MSFFSQDHDNIIKVPGYECIPENILELMESDPRYVVEGDLSFCDEFETIVSDASVFRIEDAERIHPADSDAFILVGAVEFDVSERDATAVERVRLFTRWPMNRSLEQATPSKPKANVKRPSGVQPCAADDRRCHLRKEVALSGGPELPGVAEGETLRMKADDRLGAAQAGVEL